MALRLLLWCLALGAAAQVGAVTLIVDYTSQRTANLVGNECLGYGSTDFEVDAAQATLDYFPEKFVTTKADLFTVEYHKGYKVVTQKHESPNHHKTVFYQCGLGKPTIDDTFSDSANPGTADPILYVSVPVTSVAVTSTTFFPLIELLGVEARNTIKHYTDTFSHVSSTCLQKLFAGTGTVASPNPDPGLITDDPAYASTWTIDDVKIQAAIDGDGERSVTFASAGASVHRGMNLVQSKEDENLEVAEVIGMVAAAYNLEAKANEIYGAVKGRYECVKSKVAARTAVKAYPAPRVLWFSWVAANDAGDGSVWDAGKCPNYYCEAISDAGGQFIDYKDVTASGEKWGYPYFSDADLLSLAKDADYAIVTSYGYGHDKTNFDVAIIKATLDQIKAFKDHTPEHPRVFDTTGLGQNDWLESRIAEPDVLLEDIVTALWPASGATHTPVWLKPYNVASKTRDACPDPATTPTTLQADTCIAMEPNILTIAVTNGAVGYGPSLAHVAAVAVAGLVAMVAM